MLRFTIADAFLGRLSASGYGMSQAIWQTAFVIALVIWGLFRLFHNTLPEAGLIIPTWILALATIGLFIFTAKLWSATGQLVRDGRRQHRLTNRAFLYFTRIETHPMPDHITVVGFWRNSGTTPSQNASCAINWIEHPGDLPGDFQYPLPAFEDVFLGPGVEIGNPGLMQWPNNIYPRVGNNETNLYFWGRMNYADIFGSANRQTRFCYRLMARPGQNAGTWMTTIQQYGPYNGTEPTE